MACTDVQIVNHSHPYGTDTLCMSVFTHGSSSFDKINNYIPYVPRRDKEYNFLDAPDEKGDSQLQITGRQYSPDIHRDQTKLKNSTLLTSRHCQLSMGPEFSSDIAGDGPRKRTFDDDEYDPKLVRVQQIRRYNAKRKRSKADRKADNRKQNPKRSKADRKADNQKQNPKRPLKSDTVGMEYDTSSPFPPTADQLSFTGKILGNSIAALFAQQSPSPEMSYAAVVAEQLRLYTQPIIDFTLYQFKQECCDKLFGDLNFAKAAANKALNNLEKILLLNNHYQLMGDFNVWDIHNPPSLSELKLLSKRHPYQPISELLRKEVDSFSTLKLTLLYNIGVLDLKVKMIVKMRALVNDIAILLLRNISGLKTI